MRCLEFSIFHECVNRCLFCSNTRRMQAHAGSPISFEEICEVLRRKRGEGFAHVTFTGGEPTLYPRFWEVLEQAKALGYRTQAISNGSALALAPFARRALPHLDELCLSIHGPTAVVHDALTRNDKSFERVQAALARVAASPQNLFLIVNMVVTRINIDHIGATAELAFAQNKLRQFWVSSLIPEGEALTRYDELAVPYRDMIAAAVRVAAVASRRPNAAVRFFGFPACVLGKFRNWASELYRNPSAAVIRSRNGGGRPGLKEIDGGLKDPPRVHTPRCRGCALAGDCPGVWKRYREAFGESELTAVKR